MKRRIDDFEELGMPLHHPLNKLKKATKMLFRDIPGVETPINEFSSKASKPLASWVVSDEFLIQSKLNYDKKIDVLKSGPVPPLPPLEGLREKGEEEEENCLGVYEKPPPFLDNEKLRGHFDDKYLDPNVVAPPWEQKKDAKGVVYYYNTKTRKISYSPPQFLWEAKMEQLGRLTPRDTGEGWRYIENDKERRQRIRLEKNFQKEEEEMVRRRREEPTLEESVEDALYSLIIKTEKKILREERIVQYQNQMKIRESYHPASGQFTMDQLPPSSFKENGEFKGRPVSNLEIIKSCYITANGQVLPSLIPHFLLPYSLEGPSLQEQLESLTLLHSKSRILSQNIPPDASLLLSPSQLQNNDLMFDSVSSMQESIWKVGWEIVMNSLAHEYAVRSKKMRRFAKKKARKWKKKGLKKGKKLKKLGIKAIRRIKYMSLDDLREGLEDMKDGVGNLSEMKGSFSNLTKTLSSQNFKEMLQREKNGEKIETEKKSLSEDPSNQEESNNIQFSNDLESVDSLQSLSSIHEIETDGEDEEEEETPTSPPLTPRLIADESERIPVPQPDLTYIKISLLLPPPPLYEKKRKLWVGSSSSETIPSKPISIEEKEEVVHLSKEEDHEPDPEKEEEDVHLSKDEDHEPDPEEEEEKNETKKVEIEEEKDFKMEEEGVELKMDEKGAYTFDTSLRDDFETKIVEEIRCNLKGLPSGLFGIEEIKSGISCKGMENPVALMKGNRK